MWDDAPPTRASSLKPLMYTLEQTLVKHRRTSLALKGQKVPKGPLRGPGVDDLGKVKIEFPAFDDRGECQLPNAFYWIKKFCS